MMNSIDFLPVRYREQSTRRKTHLWRVLVLALFGCAVGGAAIGQYLFRRSLQAEIVEADRDHAAAVAKNELYRNLQQNSARQQAEANLVAYLAGRWPRTRLLQEVCRAQPEAITFHRIQIARQPIASLRSARPARRGKAEASETPLGATAAERDLALLREELRSQQLGVLLVGVTSDGAALHRFVSELDQSPFFVAAELHSLEAVQAKETSPGPALSQFEVRLVVRTPESVLAPAEQETARPASSASWK